MARTSRDAARSPRSPRLHVSAEVFNLLDRNDAEIDYYYASCLKNETPPTGACRGPGNGINDIEFHPVYPISVRAALTARF